VSFRNADGLRLFGMLHRPAAPRAGAETVLILSPGVKMRVAPHRLYNKLANHFAGLGHPVLRFDFHGLGDAEGSAPEALLADFYGATQLGRYVPDTVAAMDWMQREYGVTRFIAAGLCGGALTGLLTADRDPRIVALAGLSIPVILDGSGSDAGRHATVAQLEATRAGYLRKLRLSEWRSWLRLLTFRSDYRMIVRSVTKPLRARLGRSAPTPAPATPAVSGDNTNPLFAPAFMRMVSTSRPVLLVFAESDRLYWEFEAKFMERHRLALEPYAAWYQVHVTPQANHIFSAAEWQDDMFARIRDWLAAPGSQSRQPIVTTAEALGPTRGKLAIR
jgi:hypothetical protein